jgi:hypothetical protein
MTATDKGDLSTYALDVYAASGRPRDAALEAHLAGCARCRAYLAGLDALAAVDASPTWPATPIAPTAPIAPIAPTVTPASDAPIAPITRARRGRWVRSAAAAVALAAGVALFVSGRPEAVTRYVGVKGTPAVQVLVHRERETRIWDGRAPVRPGDVLALMVACEGLGRVAVASPGATEWERLSDAACPNQGTPLPFTLVVDRELGDERVAIVFSREEMDDKMLRRAIAQHQRTSDVWVVDLVFTKEVDR